MEHDYSEIKYITREDDEVVLDSLTTIFSRTQIISIVKGCETLLFKGSYA